MSFPRGGSGLERSKGVRGGRHSRANALRRGGGRLFNSHANTSQHSHRRTPLSLGLLTVSDRENKSFTQGNKQQQTRGAFGLPGARTPPIPRFYFGTQSAVPSKRAAEVQMTSGAEKKISLPNQALNTPARSANATMVNASTQTMPEIDRGPGLSLSARSNGLVVSNSPPNVMEHSTGGHEASRIPENDVREDIAHGAETVAEWSPATRQEAEDVAAEGSEGQATAKMPILWI